MDGVDFERNYGRGAIPADVVFVDIGGGHGQECQRLRENVPDLTGRVVLQDLPPVLGEAPDMKGVEKMAYDYCTEQPVQSKYKRPESLLKS